MCRKRWNPLFGSEVDALRRNLDIFFLGLWFDGCTIEDGLERVDFVLDVVAELECRDQAFVDEDCFASAGVACRASLAGLAGERAETANFNSIAFDKLLAEEVEELFNNNFNIIAHKSGGLGDFLNQCLFSYICHALNIGLSTS